eukprot:3907938-Pyramimonas_sp.AAC.1
MSGRGADAGTDFLTALILELMQCFIPYSDARVRCCSHPWLDSNCLQLVEEKCRAAGTDRFPLAARRCSDGLVAAHNKYAIRTRERLQVLRRGSKLWWRLSQSLLGKAVKSHTPSLRRSNGSWALDPKSKADLYVSTFSGKWVLPALQDNSFSAVPDCTDRGDSGFLPVRLRT